MGFMVVGMIAGIGGLYAYRKREAIRCQWKLISLVSLPPGLSSVIKVIHMGAFMGRTVVDVKKRSEHPNLYAIGCGINQAFGSSESLQIVARVVAATKILLELEEEVALLHVDVSRLRDGVRFAKPLTSGYLSSIKKERNISIKWLPKRLSIFFSRLGRVKNSSWKLNCLFFKLFDVVSGRAAGSSVDDMALNVVEIGRGILSRDTHLADAIRSHTRLVNGILSSFRLTWKAEQIADILDPRSGGSVSVETTHVSNALEPLRKLEGGGNHEADIASPCSAGGGICSGGASE